MQQPQRITRPLPLIRDAVKAKLPPVMVDARDVSRVFGEDAGVFDLEASH